MAQDIKVLQKRVDTWQAAVDAGGSPTSGAKLAAAKEALKEAKPTKAKKAKKKASSGRKKKKDK
jgi:hypothetical protein